MPIKKLSLSANSGLQPRHRTGAKEQLAGVQTVPDAVFLGVGRRSAPHTAHAGHTPDARTSTKKMIESSQHLRSPAQERFIVRE